MFDLLVRLYSGESSSQPSPLHDTHPSTAVTGVHRNDRPCTCHNKRSWRMCVCVFHDRDFFGLVYLASVLSSKDTGESSFVDPHFSCFLFSSGSAHQRPWLTEYKYTHTHIIKYVYIYLYILALNPEPHRYL